MKPTQIISAGLALAVLAAPAFSGDKDSLTVNDLPAFSAVKLAGSMDAVITVSDRQELIIEADAKRLQNIDYEVKDGILYVKEKGRRGWSGGDVDLTIQTTALKSVTLSGSGDVEAYNIDSESFALRISGSGDAELAGRCGTLKIGVSGSGDVDAEDLACRDVDIAISGSGDAQVHASNEVSVKVSGSGDVDIYGGGRVTNSKVSGSGDLTIHSDD